MHEEIRHKEIHLGEDSGPFEIGDDSPYKTAYLNFKKNKELVNDENLKKNIDTEDTNLPRQKLTLCNSNSVLDKAYELKT
mmetsp:Transcript_9064/g.10258  ORF Transcript_9064/g.10258 Transcript_9064/m.10258 type:complete len:80 (+) Transcript_9064:137-376(+)